jgi:hypothetical protein
VIELGDGVEFASGTLHFRRGGEAAFQRVPTTDLLGTILAEFVGPRGIEYWLEVRTATSTLTDPCDVQNESPRGIHTIVPRLAEERSFPGLRYRMVSVPLYYERG